MTRYRNALSLLSVAAVVLACDNPAGADARSSSRMPLAAMVRDSAGDHGQRQFHSVSNGASGEAYWSSSGPFDSLGAQIGPNSFTGYLYVASGADTNAAYLYYYAYECDAWNNCRDSGGWGTIPSSDLKGGMSGRELHLATNTASNPDFYRWGQRAGLIELDWAINGYTSSTSTGTSTVSYQGATFKTQGSSSQASASVVGSALGLPVNEPNSGSQIGTNHNVSIELSH